MLRKLVLPALALVALPAIASAQFEAGDWELTLNGQATVAKDTQSAGVGVSVGVGYFTTKELELGLRQDVTYFSSEGGSHVFQTVVDKGGDVTSVQHTDGTGWGGSTVLFADYHFDFGRWQPFVGAFGGYSYSSLDTVTIDPNGVHKVDDDSFIYGPEVGVKYFVNGTTFVFGRAAYVFWADDNDSDTWEASIGLGVRL